MFISIHGSEGVLLEAFGSCQLFRHNDVAEPSTHVMLLAQLMKLIWSILDSWSTMGYFVNNYMIVRLLQRWQVDWSGSHHAGLHQITCMWCQMDVTCVEGCVLAVCSASVSITMSFTDVAVISHLCLCYCKLTSSRLGAYSDYHTVFEIRDPADWHWFSANWHWRLCLLCT